MFLVSDKMCTNILVILFLSAVQDKHIEIFHSVKANLPYAVQHTQDKPLDMSYSVQAHLPLAFYAVQHKQVDISRNAQALCRYISLYRV
jgi:hypothetical protein